MAKKKQEIIPEATSLQTIAAPGETVVVKAGGETVEHELQHGDTLTDKQIVVALVGASHVGAIPPGAVIVKSPATDGFTISAKVKAD